MSIVFETAKDLHNYIQCKHHNSPDDEYDDEYFAPDCCQTCTDGDCNSCPNGPTNGSPKESKQNDRIRARLNYQLETNDKLRATINQLRVEVYEGEQNRKSDLSERLNSSLEENERLRLQLDTASVRQSEDSFRSQLDKANRVTQERKEELIRFFNAHHTLIIKALYESYPNNKIAQIKSLRMMTGVDLKSSKDFVENTSYLPIG
jgi:ribosomal protein L7/L12